MSASAQGFQYAWTGIVDTNWHNPGNWMMLTGVDTPPPPPSGPFAVAYVDGSANFPIISAPASVDLLNLAENSSAFLGIFPGGVLTAASGVSLGGTVGGPTSPSGTISVLASRLTTSGLFVGVSGEGELNISAAGRVDALLTSIAFKETGRGEITVDGVGSILNAGNNLYIGDEGEGTLAITNGGAVTTGGASIGSEGGDAAGELLVSGTGSQFTSSILNIALDNGAEGDMLIQDGGLVTTNTFSQIGGQGHVMITGNGSHWDCIINNQPGLNIGNGTLTVADRGRFTVKNGTGHLTVGANGELNIGAAPGEGSPTSSILFDCVEIRGSGAVNFNHDDTYEPINSSSQSILFVGDVTVNKTGQGVTLLRGDNTHVGGTNVNAGVLRVSDLGLGAGPVTLRQGTLQSIDGDAEPLTLGDINPLHIVAGDGRVSARNASDNLLITGPVTGDGNLVIVNGAGLVMLAGAAKTYNGNTFIGRTNVPGSVGSVARLETQTDHVLPSTTRLSFRAGNGGTAELLLAETSQTVTSVRVFDGTGLLSGPGTLHVTDAPTTPQPGSLDISNATLMLSDTADLVNIDVQLNAGGRLAGTGSAGSGLLSNSDGTIAPGNSAGTLSIGSLVQGTGGTIEVEIAAKTPRQFDLLQIAGNAELGGTLVVTLLGGFAPTGGDTFEILNIAGTRTGEFEGLNEGAELTADGQTFSISYLGGDGNDIVLTAVADVTVTGDMNCDGIISVSDIGPFVAALTDPAGYATLFPDCDIHNGDINDDGAVTVGDIGAFVQLLTGA
ncbi:MAG: autotransporter-associated beta strand repeat-containing protein [Phycisphaerae bacterium]